MVVSTRWGGLRIEPYKANPKDADLDGIVQEGTIWERPDGTVIVDLVLGPIPDGTPGRNLTDRGTAVIVDRNGNRVDYTPSWAGKPLTLGERQSTIGQTLGTIGEVTPTVEEIDGTLVSAPDPEAILAKRQAARRQEAFITVLRDLDDDDLDRYIASLERKERRNTLDADANEAEWLAAARALKNEREEKKEPTERVELDPLPLPDGWEETPENAKANKETDNLNQPDVSNTEVVEEVTAYDWKKKRKERKEETKARLRRLYDKIWRRESEDEPWLLPDPEDEDGVPTGQEFDEPDQLWNALSEEQQKEYLEKMFLVGKEISLGEVEVDGKKYRLTATHELADRGIEKDGNGDIDIMGRWVFRVYDSYGNELYNSNESLKPTSFGDHRNGGLARTLLVNDKALIMNYLGTDHTAEFFDNEGNPVEIRFNQLDESLAQILNDNTFMFATELGIEKAGLEAVDKGQVVWAAQGYDPIKNSYSTIANLMTTAKLVEAWESVEALRRAGTLDPNNLEHAKLIVAAAVLGDRERYLRMKGMLGGIDISKLPATIDDLVNAVYSAEDVDRLLAEAGTSFEEIPKAGDLLHAILPEGKLRNNVLAFNMWRGGEGATALGGSERRLAIEQTDIPELEQAMITVVQQEGHLGTNNLAMWNIMEEPVTPLISASGEQDLNTFVPFNLDLWGPPPTGEVPRSVNPVARHDTDRIFYTGNVIGRTDDGSDLTGTSKEKIYNWAMGVIERVRLGPRKDDNPSIRDETDDRRIAMPAAIPLALLAGELDVLARRDGRNLQNLSDDEIMTLLAITAEQQLPAIAILKDPVLGKYLKNLRYENGVWKTDEVSDLTVLVQQIIDDARAREANAVEIVEALEDPVDAAEGISGAVAIIVDDPEVSGIISNAIGLLNGFLNPLSVSQGDDRDERLPITGKVYNFFQEMESERAEGNFHGLMTMAAIFDGGKFTKKVELDIETHANAIQEIRNNPDLTPEDKEIAIQQQMNVLVTVLFHEMAHAIDFKEEGFKVENPDEVWGTFYAQSYLAVWTLVQDAEILRDPTKFVKFLTDENIENAPPEHQDMLRLLKAVYETESAKSLLKAADEDVLDYGGAGYWLNPQEVFARVAEKRFMHAIFDEYGLIYDLAALGDPSDPNVELRRLQVEAANLRILRNAPPEVAMLFKGYMVMSRLSDAELSGDTRTDYTPRGSQRFSTEEVVRLTPLLDKALGRLGALDENYVAPDATGSVRSLLPTGDTPQSAPVPIAAMGDAELSTFSKLTKLSTDKIASSLKKLVTPRKSFFDDDTAGKELGDTVEVVGGEENQLPMAKRTLANTWASIASMIRPVFFGDEVGEEAIKLTGVDREQDTNQVGKSGVSGTFSPSKLLMTLTRRLTPRLAERAPLTLIHEYGHAYDYGGKWKKDRMRQSRMTVVGNTIFRSSLFSRFLRSHPDKKYVPDYSFGDDINTAMNNELAKVGASNGLRFRLEFDRKGLTDAQANELDEIVEKLGEVKLSKLRVQKLLQEKHQTLRGQYGVLHSGLANMTEEEFEELVQDLPYAVQPRARLLYFLSNSGNGVARTEHALIGNSGFRDMDEAEVNRRLVATLKRIQQKEPEKFKEMLNMGPTELLKTLYAEVISEAQAHREVVEYINDPKEIWARSFEQATQLKTLIKLCDGDESAARLLLDVIQNEDNGEVLMYIKTHGRIPEGVPLLNIIQNENPDLLDAAVLYASRYMKSRGDSRFGPVAFAYVNDMDEAFELLRLVDDVLVMDGEAAGGVELIPAETLKANMSLPTTPAEKETLRKRFLGNLSTFVRQAWGQEGDEDDPAENFPLQLIPQDFYELIPDGKLEAYIVAFSDLDEPNEDYDSIVSKLIREQVRRDVKREESIEANNSMRGQDTGTDVTNTHYHDPIFYQVDEDGASGQELERAENLISGSPATAPEGEEVLFDVDVPIPIEREDAAILDDISKRVRSEETKASTTFFSFFTNRLRNALGTRSKDRKILDTDSEEEKKRKRLLAEGDKGAVELLKRFGMTFGRSSAGRESNRTYKKVRDWILQNVMVEDSIEYGDANKKLTIEDVRNFFLLRSRRGLGSEREKLNAAIKLEGAKRGGKRLRNNLQSALDQAIADGDSERAEELREAKEYIEKMLFRKRNRRKDYRPIGPVSFDDLDAPEMSDPYEVFVSDTHSNWATSSKSPLAQIAQAELMGMDREEMIDKIFWQADEEKKQEIREALEAMDEGKRISIFVSDTNESDLILVNIEEDTGAADAARNRDRELYINNEIEEQMRFVGEGLSDEEYDAMEDSIREEAGARFDATVEADAGPEDTFAPINQGLSRPAIEATKLVLQAEQEEMLRIFKEAGITHITLYRGLTVPSDKGDLDTENVDGYLSPLASWAWSPHVARTFGQYSPNGHDGYLIEASVPVEAVVGSSLFGFGAWNEEEVIVDSSKIDLPLVTVHNEIKMNEIAEESMDAIMPESVATGIPNHPYLSGAQSTAELLEEEMLIEQLVGKSKNDLLDEKSRDDSDAFKVRAILGDDDNATSSVLAQEYGVSPEEDTPEAQGDAPPTGDVPRAPTITTATTEQGPLDPEEEIAIVTARPIEELAEKLGERKDWSGVVSNVPKRKETASLYRSAEEVTKEEMTEEARAAWTALATEVEEQFELATKSVEEGGLGITIEFVDEDPYATFAEMWEDYVTNGRIKVLRTEATGGHPFFTNEQNDKFRAVHDLFGHLATGRGFDRHGEEAAYQAHITMFGPDAAKAAATELRGQNSVLIETGNFPPQKLIILPEDLRKSLREWAGLILTKVLGSSRLSSEGQLDNDKDNAYDITNSHHVSGGRYLA